MKALIGLLLALTGGACLAAETYTTVVKLRSGRIAYLERVKKF